MTTDPKVIVTADPKLIETANLKVMMTQTLFLKTALVISVVFYILYSVFISL